MTALNQLIELLKLEKIDDLLFRGASQDLGFRQVFGGQVVAQALSAAIQVSPLDRFFTFLPRLFSLAGRQPISDYL